MEIIFRENSWYPIFMLLIMPRNLFQNRIQNHSESCVPKCIHSPWPRCGWVNNIKHRGQSGVRFCHSVQSVLWWFRHTSCQKVAGLSAWNRGPPLSSWNNQFTNYCIKARYIVIKTNGTNSPLSILWGTDSLWFVLGCFENTYRSSLQRIRGRNREHLFKILEPFQVESQY